MIKRENKHSFIDDNPFLTYSKKSDVSYNGGGEGGEWVEGDPLTSPSDSDYLSSMDIENYESHKFSFANLWNWIRNKVSSDYSEASDKLFDCNGANDLFEDYCKSTYQIKDYNPAGAESGQLHIYKSGKIVTLSGHALVKAGIVEPVIFANVPTPAELGENDLVSGVASDLSKNSYIINVTPGGSVTVATENSERASITFNMTYFVN